MKPAVAVAAALLLALSGCGKTGDSIYTEAASSACLVKAGLHPTSVARTSDFVAQTATGGAFRVKLPDNFVTVSFGQTQADANNINDAYYRFKANNVGLDDVLRRQGNAVMLWHVHPNEPDVAKITGCLKR